ncbi:MAG: hypothetical protein HYW89_03145 [Candidatus Sungiibacteriota bacterium]|uniref:Uncharacterized protein n=1 Tax=Candidatus Sungiibacteriota bacterium TaxID=2750080 RepID=A0A7T5RIV3_9BACT|nr:MAG: hypothetical protein HYW89_03145 [Candidatus Sungbacteria bacterium]
MSVKERNPLYDAARRGPPVAIALFILLLFVIALASIGFQYYKYWPRHGTSYYVHPVGIPIYNMSNVKISWEEWTSMVKTVDKSLETLKSCLGVADMLDEDKLLSVSIIVLPPETITHFKEAVEGFIGLKYIFIRRDLFDESRLVHEWLHAYFFLAYRWRSNLFHQSPLFKKCGQ